MTINDINKKAVLHALKTGTLPQFELAKMAVDLGAGRATDIACCQTSVGNQVCVDLRHVSK